MKLDSFWDTDRLLGISALIISMGSLFIILYQTSLIRREQYASVMPYLELSGSTKNPKHLAFELANTGLGPAMIKEVYVRYKGEKHEGGIREFYEDFFSPAGWFSANNINPGQLLPANSNIILLETGDEASYERIAKMSKAFESGEAVLEIVYASIYGEKWVLVSTESIPQELD